MRLLKALFRLRRVSALKTSSLTGMHPIELASGSEATSVSAGHAVFWWAWLDLNQRPHPYQG